MPTTWKTVRVFISSTFRDMHTERDHLVRVVFPELRERCARRHLHLVDVDLRWGVTEEDAKRGKALEVCLWEIENCRPFFIGILGQRYGWIPPTYDIPDEEAFDSVRRTPPGHSITAMEIYHGVLNNPQMQTRALFYFRDPAIIDSLPPDRQADFRAEDEISRQKLRGLKDRIRQASCPVMENYDGRDLEVFGRQMLEDLWSAIEAEHPADAPAPDPLDAERAYHDFFIETRTELFVGRRGLLKRLHDYASGDRAGPMVVAGVPGCGKSALLARFVDQFRRIEPDVPIFYHFIGTSPTSTDSRQMLLRLCRELARRFEIDEEIPQDFNELRVTFDKLLAQAAAERRVVLAIDALNQLDETYHSHDLYWLPAALPAGLRLIVSSLPGDVLDVARGRYRPPDRQDMEVSSLRRVDQGFIIARQLAQSRKRLTTVRSYRRWRAERLARGLDVPPEEDHSQLRYILTGVYSRTAQPTDRQVIERQTGSPLYLQIAAEELRLFGDFDRLEQFIAELPTDVEGMFGAVLDRLEQDHGRELVERSLSLIATGRNGLLEGEVLELLARDGEDRFPIALWSRLYRSLAFYMKPRSSVGGGAEGLIDFFHRQLAKAVHKRYLNTESVQQDRHRDLAEYFHAKANPPGQAAWSGDYPRALSELPHHQTAGQVWEQLEVTLTALPFLESKCTAGMTYELVRDYTTAEAIWPESVQPSVATPRVSGLHRTRAPEGVRVFGRFVSAYASIVTRDPSQILPFAYNYALNGPVNAAADRHLGPEDWRRNPWVKLIDRPSLNMNAALVRQLEGHEGRITAVALSSDGTVAVSGSEDGTLRTWDVATGEQRQLIHASTSGGVVDVALTADGTVAASAGADGLARLWDVSTGSSLGQFVEFNGEATSVALSMDGQKLIIGGVDGKVRVWDLTQPALQRTLIGHYGRITHVAANQDGRVAVSASLDESVRVWHVPRGEETACLEGHPFDIQGVAVDRNGSLVATCCGRPPGWYGNFENLRATKKKAEVRIWTASGECLFIRRGHEITLQPQFGDDPWSGILGGIVYDVAMTPDGRKAVSVGYDGAICIWDVRLRRLAKRIPSFTSPLSSVAISQSADRILTGGDDRQLRVWDPAGDPPSPMRRKRRIESVGCGMACSLDDKTLLMWANPRVRNWILAPFLGLLVLLLSSILLLSILPKSGSLWLALLAVLIAVLVSVCAASFIPVLAWHVEALGWFGREARFLSKIRPLRMWPLVPLCPLLPVVYCPCCGHRICGRWFLLYCHCCGFRSQNHRQRR